MVDVQFVTLQTFDQLNHSPASYQIEYYPNPRSYKSLVKMDSFYECFFFQNKRSHSSDFGDFLTNI